MNTQSESTGQTSAVQHINPETLHKNPAFSQVVAVNGPARTIYIGGQDAVDSSGQIVGKGDFKAQVEQVLQNIQAALAASGAQLEDVVKWNLYVVQGNSLVVGFEAFRRMWGDRPNPPTITFAFVAGLANPEFLIEMDAIAVVPLG